MAIITTTAGSVNTGRDILISLTGPQGGQVGGTAQLTNVMLFSYKQETIDIMKTKIDARTILADLPHFWSGTIEFERADDEIDTMISAIETNWYQGGAYTLGVMQVTVTDPGGGAFVMNFQDVSVKLEDGGEFKGDDTVRVRLGWRAAIRNA